MSDCDTPELVPTDLPITLYLNQRLTFDLLATMEGGFSRLSTVHTTSTDQSSTKISADAGLGISNVFSLLNVKLGASGTRARGENQGESVTEEIIHTPASLFARLRKELHERHLVREVSTSLDPDSVSPGDFVEFEATLRRVPLIDMLSAVSELMPLVELAETSTDSVPVGKRAGGKRQRGQAKNSPTVMKRQIDLLLSAVTAEGSEDLIAEVKDMGVVLTAERRYFIDPSMNDTIDGTFRVFGKVSRVVADESEGISLLRKTPLRRFQNTILPDLSTAMVGLQDSGYSESVEAEIRGPALQIIPIAIFS